MFCKEQAHTISSVFRNASLFCRQHYGHLIEIPPEKENILLTHLQKQYHCEEIELATLGPKPKVGRRGFGEYVDVINANNYFCVPEHRSAIWKIFGSSSAVEKRTDAPTFKGINQRRRVSSK